MQDGRTAVRLASAEQTGFLWDNCYIMVCELAEIVRISVHDELFLVRFVRLVNTRIQSCCLMKTRKNHFKFQLSSFEREDDPFLH
jgi:hypothetical protein